MRHSPSLLTLLTLMACSGEKPSGEPDTRVAVDTDTDTDTDTDINTDTDTDTDVWNASPPVAVDDAAEVDEGEVATVALTANDTDVDGDLDPTSVFLVASPVHGVVLINGDGSVDYVHDGSESLEDSFTYQVSDLTQLESNEGTVTVTIVGSNDGPEANDDAGIVLEGNEVWVDLASNDVDVDDGLDLTSIVITDAPNFGELDIGVDGTVLYTHDGSELLSDSFRYTIDDNGGLTSNTAYVSMSIIGANDPPTANNDAAFLDQGSQENLDLAANDSDPDDGLSLSTIRIVGQPLNGTVTPRIDGTVDYTHDGTDTVSDSFVYTIEDLSGSSSNVAAVSLTILPVSPPNTPPTAVDDDAAVEEGEQVNIDLAANDSDSDDGLDLTQITIRTAPAHGTLEVLGDGTVDYTHDGSETVSDAFAYTIDDLSGAPSNTATATLTITPINDPPIAEDDAGFVDEGQVVTLDLVANDTDADDGLDLTQVTVVVPPAFGAITANGDGSVDYTHDGSETLDDAFAYVVYDLAGTASNVAIVDIAIGATNDAPQANDDVGGVLEGGAVTVSVTANDTDIDGAIDPSTVTLVTPASFGLVVTHPDGRVDYTHDGSETTVDVFTYTVDDLDGFTSNIASVTLDITPVNTAPTAVDDDAVVPEGALSNLDLAANDTDLDSPLDLNSIRISTPASFGALTANPDGTVDYAHDGSNSFSDSFTYTIDDVWGATSNIATVSLTITAVNDPPIANDDQGVVTEGGATNINLGLNDTDTDSPIDLDSVVISTPPSFGSIVVNFNGTVNYFHDGSEAAEDTFGYTIADTLGAVSDEGWVTIEVLAVNDVPIAVDDEGFVDEGSVAVFDLTGNDIDADDGLNLSRLAVTSSPTNGTLVVNVNGTVDYTHDGSETIADGFLYTIEDAAGQVSNAGVVTVTITPTNDPPTANDDASVVDQGAMVSVPVSSNDSDPDGALDLTTVQIVTSPTSGTATPQPDGTIEYIHDNSFTLSDSFTYTISDDLGAPSNVATVDITVTAIACVPGNQVFSYTGNSEPFVAPCSGTFTFEVWGAEGQGGNGGDGGYATGQMDLNVGDILEVFVGGNAGFNGGGQGHAATERNGGGASDIRLGGLTLDHRILVAGGGGSSSGDANFAGGGGGAGKCGANYCGGGGALGYAGGNGGDGALDGGTGWTACHAGGAGGGGFNGGGEPSCNTCYTNTCGDAGTLGVGGNGDPWENGTCYNSYGGTSGGGGGYFGGGGSSTGNCGSGGGGGGSSWVGDLVNASMTPSVQTGDGAAIISW